MMEKLVLVQKAISKVFGDFAAKVVSDSVDVLKDAIKDADLDRKSYNRNLQTRLYRLIVDALNRFTYNKYEKQDKLYDAAESIIKGCISSNDNMDAVKSGLKMLVSGVNNDTCQEFLEILCSEICRDDNSDLYKEMDMLWKKQESEYFRGEFAKVDQNDREILEQLNDLKEVLEFIKINMSRQDDKSGHNRIPIVNRADEYAKKWNENVFLNDFNKRDKNAGINIKLKELYLEEHLPYYVWKTDGESLDDLKDLLKEYIIDNNEKKMLLILGQAGIGKSTLITWIVANLVEKKDDIYVYQFSSDLENIDWQSKNVLNDMFSAFGLEYDELENKTLILDGFDEIHTDNDRERILNKLNQDLKRLTILKSFSVIITCRENYIYNLYNIKCDYIVLQAWEETQIETFCKTYWGRCKSAILENKIQKIKENKEILGIPLILYMILALDIAIEKSSSIVAIYDQIFSLGNGVIYERCYASEHRINLPEIKKHIYRISQKMAFWIFENNADKAFISQEKFEGICENEMIGSGQKAEEIQTETLIGNFFKLIYCEGKRTNELQFVHRSIYEYFVVTYFFESLYKLKSKEEVAGKLGDLLKDGRLSQQILEFIKCKFDNLEGRWFGDIIKDVFDIMLQNGMTYYTKEKYKNVIIREMNIFSNMLNLVYIWHNNWGNVDSKISVYLRHNHLTKLNLIGVNLIGVNLRDAYLIGANLRGANLSETDLTRTNLIGAYLQKANLRETNLKEANLIGAYLRDADLKGANLIGTNLKGANLIGADLRGTDLRGANLKGANLIGADLRGVDLRKVNLKGAKLIGVDLGEADLREAIFDENQIDRFW